MRQPNGSGEGLPLSKQLPHDTPREVAQSSYGFQREFAGTSIGLGDRVSVRQSYIGGQPIPSRLAARGYGPGRISGPVAMLTSLAERWHLQPDQFATLLGFAPYEAQAASNLLTGQSSIRGRDQTDRMKYLLEIYGLLHEVFGDHGVAYDWLSEGKQVLDGGSPLSRMLKGSMEDLLAVRWLVLSLAGR